MKAFKFQYSYCTTKTSLQYGYFTSKEALDTMLSRWSTNGYKYFETKTDKEMNLKAKPLTNIVSADGVLSTTTYIDSANRGAPLHDGNNYGSDGSQPYIKINKLR
jgi:hypothetical protein